MARRIVPTQHAFTKYFLYYKGNEYEVDPPENWQDAQKEIARSVQYKGMMVTLSDQVTFSGSAAALLKSFYDDDGVIADVQIIEYDLNETTDEWEIGFSGTLDFSQYVETTDDFSCMINSETLQKKLSSRYQTEIDIDNIETLDGKEHGLGRTPRLEITMDDRDILGEALISTGTPYTTDGAKTKNNLCVFFTDIKESYNGEMPKTYTIAKEFFVPTSPDPDNLIFYNRQDIAREVNFDIRVNATFEMPAGAGLGASIELKVKRYAIVEDINGDITFTNVYTETLETISFQDGTTHKMSYNKTRSYYMEPREGLVLYFAHNFGPIPGSWEYTVDSASCNVWGPVRASATKNESLKSFDLFERMIIQIGGKNLSSELLSKSRLVVTNGYMIRNVLDENGKRPPFSITFEKLYNSYDSVEPIGLSVNGNTVKIEKREYFYQKFLSVDFGSDVANVEFSFDKEQAYSEINLGFDTSNFSREGALKEFCVRTVWVSPINSYKKTLDMISNIQGSHNTMETLRRVQYQESVERTHTRQGDSTNYFIDLRDNEDKPRTWKDDFEYVKGIKYLDSAFNLRLSPMNRIRKQGQWINFGYTQFLEKNLTFSSSTGATGMECKPFGKSALKEDASIKISSIGKPRYMSETVTFEIQPQNLFATLKEKVDGVEKAYGLFRFEHKGYEVYGYLNSFKIETAQVELQVIEKIKITE
jgi:hypothetical protein